MSKKTAFTDYNAPSSEPFRLQSMTDLPLPESDILTLQFTHRLLKNKLPVDFEGSKTVT
jgi:hypothetical protein